jgi:hypothetical protein
MADPKPALSPEAEAFAARWHLDLHYPSGMMQRELAALLAAERRAVWLEAAEIALNNHAGRFVWGKGDGRRAGDEISAALRALAEEEQPR